VSIGAVYSLSTVLFDITPAWFYVVNLVLFGCLYAVLCLAFGVIEEDDVTILRAIATKIGVGPDKVEMYARRFMR